MVRLVLADDAPEIIASDSPLFAIAHSGEMEQGCAGELCAELRGDTIMV